MFGGARTALAVFLVSAFGFLGVATSGCGNEESPVPEVTSAAQVRPTNQGALLIETFDELGLDASWGTPTSGKPPEDDFTGMTTGTFKDSDETELNFYVQLPGRDIGAPINGPLVKGFLSEGQMRGGPSFSLWPNSDSDDVGRPMPDETESALIARVANGLCMKFAGRECGEPVPWTEDDV